MQQDLMLDKFYFRIFPDGFSQKNVYNLHILVLTPHLLRFYICIENTEELRDFLSDLSKQTNAVLF